MWTRDQFEEAAQNIGKQFVASDGSITIVDLATKVAQENQLNPEGIRTMVRLANVAAFEETFKKRAESKAADRMIEFNVGDPEAVIHNLYKDAKTAHAVKVAEDYNRDADYYSDLPKPVRPLEKTASAVPGVQIPETPKAPAPTKFEVHGMFKRAQERMKQEYLLEEAKWRDAMEKLSQSVRSIDGLSTTRTEFEKNAVALLGEDILPELKSLSMRTSKESAPLCGGIKIASLLDSHVANIPSVQKPLIGLLKEAQEARHRYIRAKQGYAWVESNIHKVK